MLFIQTLIQTIWASILALGILQVVIIIIVIGLLSRAHSMLGLLGVVIFIAYLLGWI